MKVTLCLTLENGDRVHHIRELYAVPRINETVNLIYKKVQYQGWVCAIEHSVDSKEITVAVTVIESGLV